MFNVAEDVKSGKNGHHGGIPGSLRPGSEVSRCGPQPLGISIPTFRRLSSFEITSKRMFLERFR